MSERQVNGNLVAALRPEQRRCGESGQQTRAEEYFEEHPELQDDPDGALELIYGEVMLRQRAGQAPQLPEYQQRFPHLAGRLALLFEIHLALEESSLLSERNGRTLSGH